MKITDFTEDAVIVNLIDDLRIYFEDKPFIISDTIDSFGNQYVDLVQEGGGILGIALLGYTYVLEEMGIRFLSMGGTSAGAINSLLLAAAGKPEEKRTERLIELLANINIGKFMDGDSDARDFVKTLLNKKRSTFSLIANGLQVIDNFKENLGLNPGNAFRDWLTKILAGFRVYNTEDLFEKMNSYPDSIRIRLDKDQEPVNELTEIEGTIDLAIVAAEVSTETKVIFPAMWDLFYEDIKRINPADFVRASMSVPLFFEPFVLENLPKGREVQLRWKRIAKYRGQIPEKAIFVDGGIMSNFPIDLFHKIHIVPPRPTLGVKLGLERRKLNEISNITDLITGCFEAARNLRDFEFVDKNQDFKNLVAYIDVGNIEWLDFNVSEKTKLELFRRGALKAKDFLEKFDWEAYKNIRKSIKKSVDKNKMINGLKERIVEIAKQKEQALKPSDIETIERRLSFFGKKISLKALWIDDNPEKVALERALLRKIGIKTTVVESTQEAINFMENNHFEIDLILSDIRRDENRREGLDFTEMLYKKSQKFHRKVIFYINDLDLSKGVPPYAFGITNSIIELIHLVIDVAQRIEYSQD